MNTTAMREAHPKRRSISFSSGPLGLAKDTVSAWLEDYAPSMGAALAYYTMFSLAPMLLIVISVAGMVFGHEAARGEIALQLSGLIGAEAANTVQGLLENANRPSAGLIASITGLVTLFVGATSVFAELQSNLDRIWRAPAASKTSTGVIGLLRARFLSFGMLLAIGFLLLVSLVISAALSALGKWWGALFLGWEVVLEAINLLMSFVITTALFGLIYKVLPRVKVAWRDVWIGAVTTALLFNVGKLLIGLYVGRAGLDSAFGAAGSLIVLMVWVYYSAQIFLLGAEFTWLYAHRYGSRVGEQIPELSAIPTRSDTAAT
jgi:membrane protein